MPLRPAAPRNAVLLDTSRPRTMSEDWPIISSIDNRCSVAAWEKTAATRSAMIRSIGVGPFQTVQGKYQSKMLKRVSRIRTRPPDLFSLDTAVCPDDQDRDIHLVADGIDGRTKDQIAEQPMPVRSHDNQVGAVRPCPFHDRSSRAYAVIDVQLGRDTLGPQPFEDRPKILSAGFHFFGSGGIAVHIAGHAFLHMQQVYRPSVRLGQSCGVAQGNRVTVRMIEWDQDVAIAQRRYRRFGRRG